MRICLILMFVFIYNCQLFGQLSISSLGTSYTIDFDNTVSGINSGQFTGTGFQSSPSSGQIDSDGIIATGFSSSLSFGGTGTSGDFARGADDGAVTTGGLYAFLVSSSNYGLGVQPGGSDFTPGTIVMKISNGTGSTITSLFVSYKFMFIMIKIGLIHLTFPTLQIILAMKVFPIWI